MIGHILLGLFLGIGIGLIIRLPDFPADGQPGPTNKSRASWKRNTMRRIK